MRLIAALLLAATFSSGCIFSYGQLDVLQYGDAFDESYRKFNRSVRWGAWQKATPLVVSDDRERFVEIMSALGDITFTDWEVLVLEMGDGFATAHVEVRIEGYRPSTLEQRSATLVQEWEREGLNGGWQVRPQLDELYLAFAGAR